MKTIEQKQKQIEKFLSKMFDTKEEIQYAFNNIINADPTENKKFSVYLLGWIVKEKMKTEQMEEDAETIRYFLKKWILLTRNENYKGTRSISEFPDYQSLVNHIRKNEEFVVEKATDGASKAAIENDDLSSLPGVSLINSHENRKVYAINNTETANKILQPKSGVCKGQWCIKDPKYWNSYMNGEGKDGTAYLITNKGKYEYLFDFNSMSFKDDEDQNVPSDKEEKVIQELLPLLRPLLQQKYKELFEQE